MGVARAVKKAAAAAALLAAVARRLRDVSKINAKLNQAAGQTSPTESFYIYNTKEASPMPAALHTLREKVNSVRAQTNCSTQCRSRSLHSLSKYRKKERERDNTLAEKRTERSYFPYSLFCAVYTHLATLCELKVCTNSETLLRHLSCTCI